jgi:hypothetical protein
MNAIPNIPAPHDIKRRRFLPRFRTATLLWLTVVVAAFFTGRQSDEIGRRIAQWWLAAWPRAAPYKLTSQPDGSLLVVTQSPIARVQIRPTNVCIMNVVNGKDYQVLPLRDGKAELTFWHADGSSAQLTLVSKNKSLQSTPASQGHTAER